MPPAEHSPYLKKFFRECGEFFGVQRVDPVSNFQENFYGIKKLDSLLNIGDLVFFFDKKRRGYIADDLTEERIYFCTK